ncbi:NAD-P-binding protein [Mycena filopes]|nr:NAD-P-binding protein [Mycena filopes]
MQSSLTAIAFSVLLVLSAAASPALSDSPDLASKKAAFLAAPSFAVVGASQDESKFGTIVLKTLVAKGLDAVPVNPFVPESQGIPTLDTLAALADPLHTAVSIVTPPTVTLQILAQAHALGIPFVWLQPGAQDAAVLAFINAANSTTTQYIFSPSAVHIETTAPCNGISTDAAPDLIAALAA